jgi:hypothetical protein
MLGDPTARQQRFRIGEGPAPTVETDDAPKVVHRFEPDRLRVARGLAKPFESLNAVDSLAFLRHWHTTALRCDPPKSSVQRQLPAELPPGKLPTYWDCAVAGSGLKSKKTKGTSERSYP